MRLSKTQSSRSVGEKENEPNLSFSIEDSTILANLTNGKQCLWLRVTQIPLNILFDLWESIITMQSDFLKKSVYILKVIEISALQQSP